MTYCRGSRRLEMGMAVIDLMFRLVSGEHIWPATRQMMRVSGKSVKVAWVGNAASWMTPIVGDPVTVIVRYRFLWFPCHRRLPVARKTRKKDGCRTIP
jgi:hypothetical protein